MFLPATFYAYGAKHRRIALHTIKKASECPTDWAQLKLLVTNDCVPVLFYEHKLTSAIMTFETHLSGKYTVHTEGGVRVAKGGYGDMRLRFQRGVEWTGKVVLNPKNMKVTISNCQFGPNIWLLTADYYEERGVKYRSPNIIPRQLPKPGDPKGLLMDPSASRYADYSRQPKGPYDFEQTKNVDLSYRMEADVRTYLPEGFYIREEKEKKVS